MDINQILYQLQQIFQKYILIQHIYNTESELPPSKRLIDINILDNELNILIINRKILNIKYKLLT